MSIDSFRNEHSFLNNFFPCRIKYEGETYPSVEHAFQATKSLDKAVRQRISFSGTPGAAKRLGRQVDLRPDWENIKDGIMLVLLRKKFEKKLFKQKLLDTGKQELIEGNTWGDTYWGTCNGKGKNILGKLLIEVREEIRQAQEIKK